MAYTFILGVDVVEADENRIAAAFAVVEKATDRPGDTAHYRLDRLDAYQNFDATDDIAEHIQTLLTEKPYVARTVPIVNRTTGHGQDVLDALSTRGLAPVGATLSAGSSTVSGERDEMNVAVSVDRVADTLQALYHAGRLDLQPQQDTDEASRLVRGIERFGESGTDETGEERRVAMGTTPDEGPYDAVVVSTGLACWLGEEQTFDPTQHLKTATQGGRRTT